MSDLGDRRAQKKAQTRELVRTTAHRLFAERGYDSVTIADVARASDVAVQTVFNHFATKEELFFAGRVPWVEGVADAVRERAPGVGPLAALHAHLLELLSGQLTSMNCAEWRCFRATVEASEPLRTYERKLVFEAEDRLSDAMLAAWQAPEEGGERAPLDPVITAPLTAAMWLAAVRVLIREHRRQVREGFQAGEVAAAVEELGERLFAYMEAGSGAFHRLVHEPDDVPGLPEDRRAG